MTAGSPILNVPSGSLTSVGPVTGLLASDVEVSLVSEVVVDVSGALDSVVVLVCGAADVVVAVVAWPVGVVTLVVSLLLHAARLRAPAMATAPTKVRRNVLLGMAFPPLCPAGRSSL